MCRLKVPFLLAFWENISITLQFAVGQILLVITMCSIYIVFLAWALYSSEVKWVEWLSRSETVGYIDDVPKEGRSKLPEPE